MKKILLSAVFALFFATLSFASSNIVNPTTTVKPVVKKEVVKKINGDNLKPGDIEKIRQEVRNSADWLCVYIEFSDGSWILICCEAPCAIIIEFEYNA